MAHQAWKALEVNQEEKVKRVHLDHKDLKGNEAQRECMENQA